MQTAFVRPVKYEKNNNSCHLFLLNTAIKEIQPEIPDIPLFQFNSLDRENALVLHDTAPLAAELKEMSSTPVVDAGQSKPRDTVLYIYTSGTTGFPKAAVITNIR